MAPSLRPASPHSSLVAALFAAAFALFLLDLQLGIEDVSEFTGAVRRTELPADAPDKETGHAVE